MKKFRSLWMMAVMAVASFTLVSCDDSWHDPDPWRDPYGWYTDYDNRNWNNNYWGAGSQGSQNNNLIALAQMLTGEWYGEVTYSYLNADGQSRTTEKFYANMKFFQYANSKDALSGEGRETDYIYNEDGSVKDQQTLDFSWYVADNMDLYIKYKDKGSTYVMDYGSSQAGWHVGEEEGYNVDTFYGYMIGTGKVRGDILYIDLLRQNQISYPKAAKVQAKDGTKKMVSFGDSRRVSPLLKATASQLNHRR